MTLGVHLDTSPVTYVNPDRNISRKANIMARQVKIQNYEQRGRAGINPIKEMFSVNFKNRSKETIDTLTAFFQAREGTIAFSFTVPSSGGGEETIQVVCEKFTQTYFTEQYGYSCSATFRKVNVPTFNGVIP